MTHHYRKDEMEHHQMRARHKNMHQAEKKMEYAHHPGMVDNRMVKDDHQQGIERVKQKPGAMEVGQHGKMAAHGDMAHWTRSGDKLTPRRG